MRSATEFIPLLNELEFLVI